MLDDDEKREPLRGLRQGDANDVRWFFGDAEGELGLKAINLAGGGGGGSGASENTAAAEAAERWRRVDSILSGLSPLERTVLRRYYGPIPARLSPWKGLEPFGGQAGVAMVSPAAKSAYKAAIGKRRATQAGMRQWLAARCEGSTGKGRPKGAVDRDDLHTVRLIHRDCDRLVTRASRAYEVKRILLERQEKAEADARKATRAREAAAERKRREHERFEARLAR